jgi:hypothetical protein
MSEYEEDIRKHFDLPLEGNLCKACTSRLEGKYLIDKVLEMNASAQMALGTDATIEDKVKALDMARYAKATIMKIDPAFAESSFPEINLDGKQSPEAYLGEKL